MAQRYTDPKALERMAGGTCPECGGLVREHDTDNRFWVPRGCSLRPDGVTERIEQYQRDATKEHLAERYGSADVRVVDNPEIREAVDRQVRWWDNPEPDLRPLLDETLRASLKSRIAESNDIPEELL